MIFYDNFSHPRSKEHFKKQTLVSNIIQSPFLLCCTTVGGGVATFIASPYAPRNEWLSLTMNEPGSLSFSTAMAVQKVDIRRKQKKNFAQRCIICSLEAVRLFVPMPIFTLVSGDFRLVPELGCVLNKLHSVLLTSRVCRAQIKTWRYVLGWWWRAKREKKKH